MKARGIFGAPARRAAFFDGMRAALPALVATGTWGLVTGVAMVKVGLTEAQALGMTLLVFAGSAQLAALPLIAADAPVWVVLLTAIVVNLRFTIFSVGLYPYFARYSLGKRLLLGYTTSDLGFAICVQRWTAERSRGEESGDPLLATRRVWFFLGIAAANWISWQTMSIVGIFLAGQVPGTWGLEYAAILALIAFTVPMVNSVPALAGALAYPLPLKLGLLTAVFVGIAAAMAADVMQERLKAAP
jgi:predicted branched-subunit amino acid permease